jgi:hypothetical protein
MQKGEEGGGDAVVKYVQFITPVEICSFDSTGESGLTCSWIDWLHEKSVIFVNTG